LRDALLDIVGGIGRDPEVLARARAAAGDNAGRKADAEAVGTYAKLAAREGDRGTYDRLVDAAFTASAPDARYRYLDALAAFSDAALLSRTLDLAVSERVRIQDASYLIAAVMTNPAGRTLAWDFVKAHWKELQARLGVFGGDTAILEATGSFCDPAMRGDVQAFLQGKVDGAKRTLQQSLERIDDCVRTRALQQPKLAAWLRQSSVGSQRSAVSR
jgi:aminopeptidase N